MRATFEPIVKALGFNGRLGQLGEDEGGLGGRVARERFSGGEGIRGGSAVVDTRAR